MPTGPRTPGPVPLDRDDLAWPPITPETAIQLALVTDVTADFWNARERNYRSLPAQRQETERLGKLKTWCERFPVKEMVRLRWLQPTDDDADCARNLLTCFGVAAPEQWESLFAKYAVQFRRSSKLAIDKPSLSAWLRYGELQAVATDMPSFDEATFLDARHQARTLTREEPRVFQPRLSAICATAGVMVAFVPELPKSRVSGATRWVSPSRALIQPEPSVQDERLPLVHLLSRGGPYSAAWKEADLP